MGLEAEFCIRRSASSSSARRPSTKEVCSQLAAAGCEIDIAIVKNYSSNISCSVSNAVVVAPDDN
jgi:hypothetical protein